MSILQIRAWPSYPKNNECFNMVGDVAISPDGRLWWEKLDVASRVHYSVVLPETGEVIGLYVFTRIDWDKSYIGNMGIRIRADLCNNGYGKETFRPLLQEVLNSGIKTIRLDVVATNIGAIKCYSASGMKIVDEFYNIHDGDSIDFNDPNFKEYKQHFKMIING